MFLYVTRSSKFIALVYVRSFSELHPAKVILVNREILVKIIVYAA